MSYLANTFEGHTTSTLLFLSSSGVASILAFGGILLSGCAAVAYKCHQIYLDSKIKTLPEKLSKETGLQSRIRAAQKDIDCAMNEIKFYLIFSIPVFGGLLARKFYAVPKSQY
jgi:hypothetical protein